MLPFTSLCFAFCQVMEDGLYADKEGDKEKDKDKEHYQEEPDDDAWRPKKKHDKFVQRIGKHPHHYRIRDRWAFQTRIPKAWAEAGGGGGGLFEHTLPK